MNLDEIREEKEKMKKELRKLFYDFHLRTGVNILSVKSQWYDVDDLMDGDHRWRDIEIKLESI